MAFDQIDEEKLKERVIHINRVAKVVKGGRRFSFSALVVVGDEAGHVGVGLGKANEVPEAIRKGNDQARKNMFQVPLDGVTIPHESLGHFGAGKVLPQARPRRERASSPAARSAPSSRARASTTSSSKCLGTRNPHNVVHATIEALEGAQQPRAGRAASAASSRASSIAPRERKTARASAQHRAADASGGAAVKPEAPTVKQTKSAHRPDRQPDAHRRIKGLGPPWPRLQVVVANTPVVPRHDQEGHAPRHVEESRTRIARMTMADMLSKLAKPARAPTARRSSASVAASAPASARPLAAARRASTPARAAFKQHFQGGQTPMQRRLPKRGFNNPFPTMVADVNVGDLEVFAAGANVDGAALRARASSRAATTAQGPRRRASSPRRSPSPRTASPRPRPRRSRRPAARPSSSPRAAGAARQPATAS